MALETELQFLQDNVDGYRTPIAFIRNDDVTFEITYEDNSYYSMLVHDKEGNPILLKSYLNLIWMKGRLILWL